MQLHSAAAWARLEHPSCLSHMCGFCCLLGCFGCLLGSGVVSPCGVLYWFPMAAETNYHKLSGFYNIHLFTYTSGDQMS